MNKRALIIATIIHVFLFLGVAFFASREGILGQKMKTLSAILIPKEKPVEIIKPKIEERKIEIPQLKIQSPVVNESIKPRISPEVTPSIVVPPIVELPEINFSDGAKNVITTTNVIDLYKNFIEYKLKSEWIRPDNLDYISEINLTINKNGKIVNIVFEKQSGNSKWDISIKNIFSKINSFEKIPPKEFPLNFIVRFDTVEEYANNRL